MSEQSGIDVFGKKINNVLFVFENETDCPIRHLMNSPAALFSFMELRHLQETIEYYKTAGGREVNFIATDRKGRKSLVQVAAEMDKPTTRSRELKALKEAMKELGISRAVVVTLGQEERLKTEAGLIHILPAWLWALSLPVSFLSDVYA